MEVLVSDNISLRESVSYLLDCQDEQSIKNALVVLSNILKGINSNAEALERITSNEEKCLRILNGLYSGFAHAVEMTATRKPTFEQADYLLRALNFHKELQLHYLNN